MAGILDAGARIVGGCCGTTPEHIAALRRLLDEGNWLHNSLQSYRPSFIVTSAQAAVELAPDEEHIAIIGERINPTGKPRLKDALVSGDYDLVISEAVAQVEAGASILDVNVGVPGIDEPAVLRAVTERLQATLPAPLQLDSSSPAALEAACRSYAAVRSSTPSTARQRVSQPCYPSPHATALRSSVSRSTKTATQATAAERLAIAERILEACAQSRFAPRRHRDRLPRHGRSH